MDDKLPKIEVAWDAENQAVSLKFKPEDFKNWEMVEMLLTTAVEQAKRQGTLARMAAFQRFQQEQAHNAALAQQIKMGRH